MPESSGPESSDRGAYEQMTAMEQFRQRLTDPGGADVEAALRDVEPVATTLSEAVSKERPPRPDASKVLGRRAERAGSRGSGSTVRTSGRGAGEADVETRANLRMSHVPTALVHVFDDERHPLVTFDVKGGTARSVRLRVRSRVEGYSADAVDTLTIAPDDAAAKTVRQLPTFFPDRLQNVNEATRATLHVEMHDLDAEGAEYAIRDHRTFRIWLLPRTTAILHQNDPSTGLPVDMTSYLALWVTPNAPAVMDLLREAAELAPGQQIVDYQSGPGAVEPQIQAMFDAAKAKNLTYVNSVLATGSDDVLAQRVRLPRESIARQSANCLDGTVLYASLIEAASMQPGIVLIPGHAFLAWRRGPDSDAPWDFLETTMTGSSDFAAAQKAGRQVYQQMAAQGQARILEISALRRQGHIPLE